MGFFKRLMGVCRTRPPADSACWIYEDGRIEIDLNRAPELSVPAGAIRLEKKTLPDRILIFNGGDQQFHAIYNRCSHMGRRLDPLPDTRTIQCCSVSGSTYDYSGGVMSGPAKESVKILPVVKSENRLYIHLKA
ncbi:MAG: Rieske 2Fe-2S domain-containing protein [Desulfobacterales bacterium]|nr:Rieske 2Fe-2S domain-containing protein [Desulfobacterales bacterium]